MAAIADSISLKPIAYARGVVRRLGLTGFGHWWARELSAALPARFRAALLHRRARPVLAFEGSRATLWQSARTNGHVQMNEVAQIPLYADAQTVAAGGRAALAPLVGAAGGTAPQVVVALSPRVALRKTLTLPAALEANLHQALAYDLDRHTPFKPEELYFDAAVIDRDPARNALHVDLAAARRVLVDGLVRQAESFGARVVAVVVDPPAAAAAARLNLLPEDRRVATAGWTRWQVVLPALLLALGALAALYLPIWQKRTEAIALNQLTDQARERATASDALRTELERRVSDYNFALERKYAYPGAVQVLDDVTRILPDDTWLTQFELHTSRGKDAQRELTLRGESANAGRLVSLLEDSKLFTQSAPRSPTTKIQPGPGEIFDVGTHVKALTPPVALPLDMTPPPPPIRARPAPAAPPAPSAGAKGSAPPAAATAPAQPAPSQATTAPPQPAPPPATTAPAPPSTPANAAGTAPRGSGAPARTPPPAPPAAAGGEGVPASPAGTASAGVPAPTAPPAAAPAPPPAPAQPQFGPLPQAEPEQGEGNGG